jgi:hypothetical protein
MHPKSRQTRSAYMASKELQMISLHWRKKLARRKSFWEVMTGKFFSSTARDSGSNSSFLTLIYYRGGFVVWRAAQWYPDLITHVFSVCTPYTAPHKVYFSTEDLVKGQLPQFGYQLHLASGEVEKSVKDEQSIRQFLRGPNSELVFDPEKGILAENLPIIGESRILNGKVSGTSSFLKTELVSICEEGNVKCCSRRFGSREAKARHDYFRIGERRVEAEEASQRTARPGARPHRSSVYDRWSRAYGNVRSALGFPYMCFELHDRLALFRKDQMAC